MSSLRFGDAAKGGGHLPHSLRSSCPAKAGAWDAGLPRSRARAFSSEVATGSREENASKQESRGSGKLNRPAEPGDDSPSILDPVAVQVVAAGIEPFLGAFDRRADPGDDAPEPRRVIHLDQM